MSGCWPLPLCAGELAEWMALRRVISGGVARLPFCWLYRGRPLVCYLVEPLDDAVRLGLVVLADGHADCMSRAALTENGTARYHTLCDQRAIPLDARNPLGDPLPIGPPERWLDVQCVAPPVRRREATP